MSHREIAIELIKTLPEDTPLHEIARKIEFISGIQKAREEPDERLGMSPERAKELVGSAVQRQRLN